MARIKTYEKDVNITPQDKVIGSDADNDNATKNYTIEGLTTYFGNAFDTMSQDNKVKVINFGSASSPDDVTDPDIALVINSMSAAVSVERDEIPLFVGYVSRGRGRSEFRKYVIQNSGFGSYGTGGSITVTNENLELIFSEAVGGVIAPPITDSPDAVVNDLGEIGTDDFSNWINTDATGITIGATGDQYIEFTNGGLRFLYRYDGASGTFNTGNPTFDVNDTFLIYDENLPPTHEHELYKEEGTRLDETGKATIGDYDNSANGFKQVTDIGEAGWAVGDVDNQDTGFVATFKNGTEGIRVGQVTNSETLDIGGQYSELNQNGITIKDGGSGFQEGIIGSDSPTTSTTVKMPGESGTMAIERKVKVTLSSAQVLTLNTIPVEIIPAPGAGKIINIISAIGRNTFNSVAFDAPGDLIIANTSDVAVGIFSENGNVLVNAGVDKLNKMTPVYTSTKQFSENEAVVARLKTGNPTVGNGAIDVYVTYEIITL